MAEKRGATSAVRAKGPRAGKAELETTDLVTPVHDLHDVVEDIDPSETSQDYSAGYHSIHTDDHHIHEQVEATELADDEVGIHIDLVEGFENPKNLTAPPARTGYAQCWVNKTTKDYRIMEKRGYRLRDPSTVPKSFRVFQTDRDEASDMIEAADMVLMEIPLSVQARNTAAEEEKARRLQMASTDMLRSANDEGARIGAKPITGTLERN